MPTDTSSPLTVIKVGGSLLTLSDLGSRLSGLLVERTDTRPVLVVGGGGFVDHFRELAKQFSLSEEFCHQAAIQVMSMTAAILTEILPNAIVVDHPGEAEIHWRIGRIPVLRLEKWLQVPESEAASLPQSWETTSDSLAALVARTWQADELWLLKSTDLPADISLNEASEAGLVDRVFPAAATGVPQGWWCNLRADRPELRRWW